MKFKWIALGLVLVLGAWFILPSPSAQQRAEVPPEVIVLAATHLEQALKLASKGESQRVLGFSEDEDVSGARLETPIPIRTLGYDALLEYEPGMTIESFKRGPARVVVPVAVGAETRSWITVVETSEGWNITGLGDQGKARQTSELARKHAERAPRIFHAPAFQLYALEVSEGDQQMIVPIGPSTVPGLAPGTPTPADEFLAKVADYARELDTEFGEQIRNKRIVN